MRDQTVRVMLGIPLAVAARLAGVSHVTIRLYEADPFSVKGDAKREQCAQLYRELRALLERCPGRRSAALAVA